MNAALKSLQGSTKATFSAKGKTLSRIWISIKPLVTISHQLRKLLKIQTFCQNAPRVTQLSTRLHPIQIKFDFNRISSSPPSILQPRLQQAANWYYPMTPITGVGSSLLGYVYALVKPPTSSVELVSPFVTRTNWIGNFRWATPWLGNLNKGSAKFGQIAKNMSLNFDHFWNFLRHLRSEIISNYISLVKIPCRARLVQNSRSLFCEPHARIVWNSCQPLGRTFHCWKL